MPLDGKVADYVKNDVADVLRRAKALIPDEASWFQGGYGRNLELRNNSLIGNCVRTAITRAAAGMAAWGPAEKVFARANNISTADGMAIPAWNNADEREFADIHPAFDRAIALAERR